VNLLSAILGGFPSLVDVPACGMLLLKATALLAVAWAAHGALGRRNPRWRVVVWRVAAVGLVALPVVTWLLPAMNIYVEQPAATQSLPSPIGRGAGGEGRAANDPRFAENLPSPVGRGIRDDGRFENEDRAMARSQIANCQLQNANCKLDDANLQSAPSTSQALTPAQPALTLALSQGERGLSFNSKTLLLPGWLAVMGLLAARLLLGHWRIRRLIGRVQQPPEAVQALCDRIARAIGCRRPVQVVRSPDVASPILCGLRQPRLVLPEQMCKTSYRGDLPGILAHELSHVRSHDLLWNVGLELLSIALWFHPLAWRMRRTHLAACELVCDATSATFVGDVSDYCRTLARVAVDACRSLPAAGIAMARTSAITHRLNTLRRRVFHTPLRRRNVWGLGMAALATVAIVGSLRFAMAEPPADKPATAADNAEKGPAKDAAAASNAGTIRISAVDENGNPAPKAAVKIETRDAVLTAHSVVLDGDKAAATGNAPVEAAKKPATLRVRVLDPDGKPLPGVNVHASVWTNERGFKANHDYKTDATGQTVVVLPNTFDILRLFVTKDSYVPLFKGWEESWLTAPGNRLPESYTFKLRKGTVIGGVVKNEAGQPIPGVKVEVMCHGGRCLSSLAEGDDARTTDAQGRWTLDNVPKGDKIRLLLRLNHPDYVSDQGWGGLQNEQDVTLASLRAKTATIVMHRGIAMTGSVTNPGGRPVAGAVVAWGKDPYFETSGVRHEVRTDAQGVYRIPALPPGKTSVTVMAVGFAPDLKDITLSPEHSNLDFRLKAGKEICLRFVDSAGKPIPKVCVDIESWRGAKSLYNIKHPNVLDSKIPERAGKNGVWRWTWAPDDAVSLSIYSYPIKGFAPCTLKIAGGEPPRTVTLKPEHRITGRVTDAVTGKPITAFTVIPLDVFRKNWLSAERQNAARGKDGRLDYLASRTDIPLRLRIEAAGYRTQDGPEFRVGDDAARIQDFRMRPSEPVVGVVLDADGKPATKADVLVATPTEWIDLESEMGDHQVSTDGAGRFEFPDPGERFTIVAKTSVGFALADFPAGQHNAGILRLQPWASIRGRFLDGGKPVKNATFFVSLIRLESLDQPRVGTNHLQVRTDKDGRFEFPRVPPRPVYVRVYLGPWEDAEFRSGPSVPLDLKPGQQVELKLGEAGATIRGNVKLTGRVPPDLDCTYSLNWLVRREPGVKPPAAIAQAGFDIRKGYDPVWSKTEEGETYLSTLQQWFVKLAPDGGFRISGVPPGDYDLAFEIYAKPSGCLVEPLGRHVVRVTVTPEDAARGEMTLPETPVKIVPIPMVGDTPALKFELPDGKPGSLADFRGRYTVVHFWASWCGPCKEQLPALRQLHKRLTDRGAAVLGISLDTDADAWQASLKQHNTPWPEGRLSPAGQASVSSVPAYWLLDRAGKLIAKATTVDELAAAADKAEMKSGAK
jgi:beta-lactamase regulating signal transducer with metallopeptidase domain/uncharacterized GH25 family protein/thiol-disulfide isomerase/thioredoxin